MTKISSDTKKPSNLLPSDSTEQKDMGNGVKSVDLALDILEIVYKSKIEMGVSEIAKMVGVTKTTVFRHLQTMTRRGYLSQNTQTSKYYPGDATKYLQASEIDSIDLLSASVDTVRSLVTELGQTIVVSEVSNGKVSVLHTELGNTPIEIGVRIGSQLPLHATAQGKIALAYRRDFIDTLDLDELISFTDHTIVSKETLLKELEIVTEQGWASSPDESTLGINAIAAPIFDTNQKCVGTLAVVGSVQFIPRRVNPEISSKLISSANHITQTIHNKVESSDKNISA